jgi:KaiC domain protein
MLKDIIRVNTGIKLLDDGLEGGIPKGNWVVITGEPGTGKSILCMHYAYAGLLSGDPVIYVTTEAEFRDVIRQARQFNMNLDDFNIYYLGDEKPERQPQLVVIDIFSLLKTAKQLSAEAEELERKRRYAALEIETLIAAINEGYRVLGLTDEKHKSPLRHVRLVIDSISAFWADKPAMARKYSYQLKIATHRENVTALLVSQYAMTTKSVYGDSRVGVKVGSDIYEVAIEDLFNELLRSSNLIRTKDYDLVNTDYNTHKQHCKQ